MNSETAASSGDHPDQPGAEKAPFAAGDHVYKRVGHIPLLQYQHHAIVVDEIKEEYDGKPFWTLKTVVFSQNGNERSSCSQPFGADFFRPFSNSPEAASSDEGRLRVRDSSANGWFKVKYDAGL